MFDQVFKKVLARRRMAASHLAIILKPFAAYLCGRGHVTGSIQMYVQAVEHFGRWLKTKCASIPQIRDKHAAAFLERHLPVCHCEVPAVRNLRTCRAALARLLDFLRHTRTIPTELAQAWATTPAERLLADYDRHMTEVRGLALQTRRARIRYAKEFLVWRFRKGPLSFNELQPRDLSNYVTIRSKALGSGSVGVMVGGIRGLLRFLEFSRKLRQPLSRVVPRPAPTPVNPPTRILRKEEKLRVLRSFDRRKPSGLRDFAVGLCLSELGLRASEVAALCIDDLDWKRMTVRLAQTKQQRERVLPLPSEAARALAYYLKNGRPQSRTRAVFVRHRAPLGDALKPHHVHGLIRRAFVQAGIPPTGTHTLRHTWATEAHRRGVPLKSVADVLGHTSLNSTSRYTHINLEELRQAALPWPASPR